MNSRELDLLHMTTALRTQMMDSLTDADLAFALPNNPTLGQICREMGDTERSYIDSFKTFKWSWKPQPNTAMETSVGKLKAWFQTLDQELDAVLEPIPDTDFQSKTVDRGGWEMPLGGNFHTYREALLIYCGRCSVYLMALGKPMSEQFRTWIVG
ncbi:MAG: hypothetical protein U0528_10110 [Anaerolineae bacterium]|nr:hypothetical protein [Anaerolineae bacterium]